MVREIEVIDAAPEFELCFRLLSKQIGAIFQSKFAKITKPIWRAQQISNYSLEISGGRKTVLMFQMMLRSMPK